jgi:hypothetical protein
VGVRAGDADVGVAQDLLDHGEGHALLQEERGGGVPGRADAMVWEPGVRDIMHELKMTIFSGQTGCPACWRTQINPGIKAAEKYGGLSMNHLAELAEVERTPTGSSAYQTESPGCGRPRR